MLLTDICRFVQLILLLSHFQSAPRVFLWDDKHWVASLHIFRRADIIQAATQWSVHHWYIQGYSVNVPLSKKSREKLCFT